mgnify:CR=1 FL=1
METSDDYFQIFSGFRLPPRITLLIVVTCEWIRQRYKKALGTASEGYPKTSRLVPDYHCELLRGCRYGFQWWPGQWRKVVDKRMKSRNLTKDIKDMITGMQLSPDGSYLLTKVMDNELMIWDLRSYAQRTATSRPLQDTSTTLRRYCWSAAGHPTIARSLLGVLIVWSTSGTWHQGGSCTSFLGTTVPLMRPLSIPPSPSSDPAAATSRFISGSFRTLSLPQLGIPVIFG